MSDRARQWGGVAAIVFVVLILITIFSGGSPPAADDSAEKIRTYFIDHRGALLVANLLGVLAIPFVLWFLVVLRDTLRGDAMANALGNAAFAGLVVTAAMALAGGAVAASVVYVDGFVNTVSADTVQLVFEAQTLLFAATAAGLILFSLTAGLAIQRTGALPAYTMWLAFLATLGNVLTVVSTASSDAAMLGLAGVTTFALFVLVTGITMALGKATVSTAPV
jgi:hypothetical protein